MAKQIYFHVDAGSMPISFYDESTSMSYYETCELLSEKADTIHTTDMAHFSFDLIDMGYEIYLCYKDKKVKIEPDMTIEPIGKHLKRGHNIRKLFIGHAFDDMLGIECKKTVMRPKFLVSDEVVCEMTVRKVEEVRYSTEFNSYMYKLDKGGWFLESALKPNVQDNKKANFKVGDFICHKYNSIYGDCRQICDISGDSYLCTIPGSIAATCSISFSEQGNWRLWAVEDAKIGDVLSVEWNEEDGHVKKDGSTKWEKIVIFKSVNEQGVEGYGCTFVNGKLAFSDTEVPYYSKTWTKTLKPATREQRSCLFAELEKAGYKWDNNKCELISTKPKLSVGNWVVYNNRELADLDPKQIIDFVDDKYVLDYGSQGNISFEIGKLENDWHLWNFEDSKLGDILYDKAYNRIGIFENFGHHPDGGSFNDKTYCYLSIYYDIDDNELYEEAHNDMDGCDAVPATKEQRDLLFKKMKEDGYTWDSENKTLKQIQPHYDISYFQYKQWVLVRQGDGCAWRLDIFSHLKEGALCQFECVGNSMVQCIPFDGNEHLLGTTDPCDEFYVNW